ncbi:MAG: porin family protein [Bacteroidota bacterium]|nr:porin family protein [Bacteroidota bacterium]
MKSKLILIISFVMACSVNATAQKAYENGSNVIDAGVGLGGLYWGSGYGFPIGLGVSYEHGVTDKISVGGEIGYQGARYNYSGGHVNYTGLLFAVKGSYHFATSDKLDPYAGLDLGYVNVSATDHNTSGFSGFTAKAGGLGWGIHVGARYYFQPNIGVYAELGANSFSVLGLGVCFKL